MPTVRQPTQRHTKQRVEYRKGSPTQESQLSIGQVEVALDIDSEDREDLPIDEIEDIDHNQHAQDIPAICGRWRILTGLRRSCFLVQE